MAIFRSASTGTRASSTARRGGVGRGALVIAVALGLAGGSGRAAACVFGPSSDSAKIGAWLAGWAERNHTVPLGQWGASLDRETARLTLGLAAGKVEVSWRLAPDCSVVDVAGRVVAGPAAALPGAAALAELAAGLPAVRVPQVRPPLLSPAGRAVLLAVGLAAAFGAWWLARRRRAQNRPLPSARRLARGLVRSLATAAVCLVALEGLVRLFGVDGRAVRGSLFFQAADLSAHRISADPFLHYELRPEGRYVSDAPGAPRYEVNIDAFGARRPTHPAERAPGTFRILAAGASTLYGAVVSDEQTLPARLEARLEAARTPGAPHFEVWNFGTSAYTVSMAAHLARTRLAAVDPDLVVVQVHNTGRRPYLMPEDQRIAHYPREIFDRDPDFVDEQFSIPPWIGPAAHRRAFARSALYRALISLRRRVVTVEECRACDALDWQEVEALGRAAAARGVPVIYLGIPADHGQQRRQHLVPDMPDLALIDLDRPGRGPEFYEAHPPAATLDEYAALLAEELRSRGLLVPQPGR